MLGLAMEVMPDKYKRRNVSAIRHFPKGCGRFALPIDEKLLQEYASCSPPSTAPPSSGHESGKLSTPAAPLANGTVVPEAVMMPKMEPEEPAGHLESLKPVKIEVSKASEQIEVADSQRSITNGTAELPAVESLKREPSELPGSYESSQPEETYESPESVDHVEAADLPRSAVSLHVVKDEVKEVNGTDAVVKVEIAELSEDNSVLPNLSSILTKNGGFDAGVSKLYGPSKRREVSAIRHFPSGCGRNAPPMIREERLKAPAEMYNGSVASLESTGEQRLTVLEADKLRVMKELNGELVGSDNRQAQENALEDVGRGSHEESVSKSAVHWSLVDESMGKKVPIQEGPNNMQEGAHEHGRDVGSHFLGISNEAITEECINYTSVVPLEGSHKGAQEIYKHDTAKHASKVEPEEDSRKERFGNKTRMGLDDKQVVKKPQSTKIQENETPCLDVKTQSQLHKAVVREAAVSVGKFAKLRKEKNTKSWKDLETKEEDNTLNVTSQGEESMSSVVRADTIIVQALMAAPNCPWRQGRQNGVMQKNVPISGNKAKKEVRNPKRKSLSFEIPSMPGNKAKKEVRTPKRKRLSFETTVHQPQNKSGVGDDPLLEDGEDERALVPYTGPQELSVNVPPFGPFDSDQDGSCNEEAGIRTRVRKALRLFQVLCRKLLQAEESKSKNPGQRIRVDLTAASILKDKNEFVNSGKPILGAVPGVEVGDEFHYRAELCVVGLHRSYQGGIDFAKIDGRHLAMSIVASVGHADEMDSSDVLIYSGSGGSAADGDKPPEDQKLERGNLALKNCIDAKTPVRVIRGFKELRYNDVQDGKPKLFSTFTYDGLYLVEDYWLQEGAQGFSVYKFKLRRIPGQPEIALKEVKRSRKSAVREGLCIADISEGKEKIPISVVNTIDDERPTDFKYVTKMIYPSGFAKNPPEGCACTRRCSDSEKCACAVKNGGEIPFNFNGAIVQAKPLVYECGPSCKCPPSCHNRVSQHGIKIRLEIFKTLSRGWGVRSLTSIPSGSFICEYIGEMIEDKEAEQRSNDQYLFDIGHNYDDRDLWEGLPTLIPDSHSSSHSKDVGEGQESGFTIDAAKYGNVGRFINHSCSPNLYAQNVLYDHDDKKMPHIMFFAAENIPPLQELSYHYNYTVGQVRDSEGNMKTKDCYCGSHECTGRLY